MIVAIARGRPPGCRGCPCGTARCCPAPGPCSEEFSVLAALRVFVCSRSDTALEVLALRQQVAMLKRQQPRPTLTRLDRFFWTTLRHLWPRWSDVLLIVKPETIVRWHRAGFRLYWRWRSRPRGGRPRISEEI